MECGNLRRADVCADGDSGCAIKVGGTAPTPVVIVAQGTATTSIPINRQARVKLKDIDNWGNLVILRTTVLRKVRVIAAIDDR